MEHVGNDSERWSADHLNPQHSGYGMPSTRSRFSGRALQRQKCQARNGLQWEVPWHLSWVSVHNTLVSGQFGSAFPFGTAFGVFSPWIPSSFFTFSQAAQAESLWDRGGGATVSSVSSVLWEPGFLLWFQQRQRWQVDYRGDEVSVENFLRLLTGTQRDLLGKFQHGSFGVHLESILSRLLGHKPLLLQSDLEFAGPNALAWWSYINISSIVRVGLLTVGSFYSFFMTFHNWFTVNSQ